MRVRFARLRKRKWEAGKLLAHLEQILSGSAVAESEESDWSGGKCDTAGDAGADSANDTGDSGCGGKTPGMGFAAGQVVDEGTSSGDIGSGAD